MKLLSTIRESRREVSSIRTKAHSLLPITLLSVAKAALLKTEIGGSQQILAELAHEEAELKAKLNGIEQKNRESYRNILKALADTEKAIKDIEIFLGRPYEDNLAAENSELKKKLKGLNRELKIEDDNCSSVSSISSVSAIPAHMPVVEKISTNVTDYFKNPNDFSFMRGTPPRQKRPPTSPAGKKAQPLKPQNFAIERSPHKRQSPRSTGPIVKKVRTSPQQLESTKSIIAVASQPKNKRKQKEPKSLTTHLEEMQQLRPSAPKRKPDAADSSTTPSKVMRVESSQPSTNLPAGAKTPPASDEVVMSSEPDVQNQAREVSSKPKTPTVEDPVAEGEQMEVSVEETPDEEMEQSMDDRAGSEMFNNTSSGGVLVSITYIGSRFGRSLTFLLSVTRRQYDVNRSTVR